MAMTFFFLLLFYIHQGRTGITPSKHYVNVILCHCHSDFMAFDTISVKNCHCHSDLLKTRLQLCHTDWHSIKVYFYIWHFEILSHWHNWHFLSFCCQLFRPWYRMNTDKVLCNYRNANDLQDNIKIKSVTDYQ